MAQLLLSPIPPWRSDTWHWVKGHAGHEQNERIDGLANAGAQKAAMAVGFAERAR